MGKRDEKVTLPACQHPLDQAFDQPREDGSGRVDKICGVCGITMCEVVNPEPGHETIAGIDEIHDKMAAEATRRDSICNEWRDCEESGKCDTLKRGGGFCFKTKSDAQEINASSASEGEKQEEVLCGNSRCNMFMTSKPGNCRAIADMIKTTGEQKSADGCKDFKPLHQSDTFPAETFSETMDGHPDGDDDREQICVNDECPNFDKSAVNGCGQLEHVYECEDVLYKVDYETKEEGDAGPEAEAETEGAEEVVQAAGGDAGGDDAEAVGGLKEKLVEHINREKSDSYVTRDPDKIGGRFQELLPVPVDDAELAGYGQEMAEQFATWRKTKADQSKFTKACKEVIEKCEDRMVELELIIQDQARMAPVDCQWEYDFTARVKKLRRCDTWKIVKEETLSIEECQGSFDFTQQQSAAAVEQLRQAQEPPQEESATGEPDEPSSLCASCMADHPNCDKCCASCPEACPQAQYCRLTNSESICSICTGECGDYTPGTRVTECPAFLPPQESVEPPCEACGEPVTDQENVGTDCNLHPACVDGGVCVTCVSPYHCTDDDAVYTPKHGKKACREYSADLDKDQVAWRDSVCKEWRGCDHIALCFGPGNEQDACDCISDKLKEQETLF